jgi:hypothetical protein
MHHVLGSCNRTLLTIVLVAVFCHGQQIIGRDKQWYLLVAKSFGYAITSSSRRVGNQMQVESCMLVQNEQLTNILKSNLAR